MSDLKPPEFITFRRDEFEEWRKNPGRDYVPHPPEVMVELPREAMSIFLVPVRVYDDRSINLSLLDTYDSTVDPETGDILDAPIAAGHHHDALAEALGPVDLPTWQRIRNLSEYIRLRPAGRALAARLVDVLPEDDPQPDDLLMEAWGLIANASDWGLRTTGQRAGSRQTEEWVEAAQRWRDRWHETLPHGPTEGL